MADPANFETWATGGIVVLIMGACATLINWFRSAAKDGESLADQRIAALMADFEAYRARTNLNQAALDQSVRLLREELDRARAELSEALGELRAANSENRDLRRQLNALATEVHSLGPSDTAISDNPLPPA